MSAPAGKQILDLGVHSGGIIERHLFFRRVEIVLRLLGHGEGPGDGGLNAASGVGAQKLDVADFDWMLATDFASDARDNRDFAGAAHDARGMIEVDAFERGSEAVGVTLAPDLAVGNYVEAGAFLIANSEDRRVVLSLVEPLGRDAPKFLGAHTRRQAMARAWRGR